MVYLKWINYKTGKHLFEGQLVNYVKPTPSDKLKLTACRIFGTSLNYGQPTGMNEWKKTPTQAARAVVNPYPINDERRVYPYYYDKVLMDRRKEKFEQKKMKILMKGIKLGKKKGGQKMTLMDIYEKKKEAEAENSKK